MSTEKEPRRTSAGGSRSSPPANIISSPSRWQSPATAQGPANTSALWQPPRGKPSSSCRVSAARLCSESLDFPCLPVLFTGATFTAVYKSNSNLCCFQGSRQGAGTKRVFQAEQKNGILSICIFFFPSWRGTCFFLCFPLLNTGVFDVVESHLYWIPPCCPVALCHGVASLVKGFA